MNSVKFGKKIVVMKIFNSTYEPINIFEIDFKKIVISEEIQCLKGQSKFIVGYFNNDEVVPIYFKTPKDCFTGGVRKFNEKSPWKMGFNIIHDKVWFERYQQFWDYVGKKMNINDFFVLKSDYINAKLISWEGNIKTNFHGIPIPYSLRGEATGILKTGSIYKQSKNYYPQVFLKECKFKEICLTQTSFLTDEEDIDILIE